MQNKSINANTMYRAYLRMPKAEREKFNSLIQPAVGGETDIVSYSIGGEPVSRLQYCNQINEALEQIERGEYIDHSDFLKELENFE